MRDGRRYRRCWNGFSTFHGTAVVVISGREYYTGKWLHISLNYEHTQPPLWPCFRWQFLQVFHEIFHPLLFCWSLENGKMLTHRGQDSGSGGLTKSQLCCKICKNKVNLCKWWEMWWNTQYKNGGQYLINLRGYKTPLFPNPQSQLFFTKRMLRIA